MTTEPGAIFTGNVTGTGIAIGHCAQANVTINQIVQGLGDLPTHYDAPSATSSNTTSARQSTPPLSADAMLI